MTQVIDEGEQDKLFIKLTNQLTGEITEVEITNAEQAKNKLLELTASGKVIEKAISSLKGYLDAFLGDDEQYVFADGKTLKRVQRSTVTYRPEILKKYLDSDQIDVCLKVDKTTTDKLIAEMMEKGELPPDTLKQIREQSDVKSSAPYVQVI